MVVGMRTVGRRAFMPCSQFTPTLSGGLAGRRRRSGLVRHEYLEADQHDAERQVGEYHDERPKRSKAFDTGKHDSRHPEDDQSESHREPGRGLFREQTERAEEECRLRRNSCPHDRGFPAADAAELREREMDVVMDAEPESVCVHVCEPENDGGDGNEEGDVPGSVRERLRPSDDDRHHDNRPVDETL